MLRKSYLVFTLVAALALVSGCSSRSNDDLKKGPAPAPVTGPEIKSPVVMPEKATEVKSIPGAQLLCQNLGGTMVDEESPVAYEDKAIVVAVSEGKAYIYSNFEEKGVYQQVFALDIIDPAKAENGNSKLTAGSTEISYNEDKSKSEIIRDLTVGENGIVRLEQTEKLSYYEGEDPYKVVGPTPLIDTCGCTAL